MSDALLECRCGHVMRVSTFAVGSRGRCPGCGAVITVEEDDLRPIASAVERIALAPPAEDTCARCGKVFRGDWDRVETSAGIMCHHCSVLGVEGVPDRFREPKARDEAQFSQGLSEQRLEPAKEPFTQSAVFKRGLLSLALGMVALTIATAMFEGFEVPESARSEAPAEAIQLPPFAERLLAFWDFLAVFIAGFIAIYIGLSARSHLPRETIKGNLLHVGVASAALFAMHTILVLAAMLIGQLPMAGGIYAMLLGLARLALAYYILERLLDVDFTDFLLAFVIYLLLRFIVMDIVRIGIATALYHATT